MSKKLGLVLVLVFSLMVGAATVQADDTPLIPSFADGRLNAFDAGAPLILYYTHDTVAGIWDDTGLPTEYEVFSGIEVLRWDNDTESSSLVMQISADELKDAIANTTEDSLIAEVNGVTLNYSASGWLWVTSAPDSEGKVYSFSWEQDF